MAITSAIPIGRMPVDYITQGTAAINDIIQKSRQAALQRQQMEEMAKFHAADLAMREKSLAASHALDPLREILLQAQIEQTRRAPSGGMFHGSAQEAHDLERLRQEVGEDSPVYQNALDLFKSKVARTNSLIDQSNRRASGLRPGESYVVDPESGENIGIEHSLTPKEREEHAGRGFFNYIYPYAYKGYSPFAGVGSINRIVNAAKLYGKDPKATQAIDDFLLAEKALTATMVKEAATLGSGHTNQTYKQLRESLESSDIPKLVKRLVKEYNLPPTAMLKASVRFQNLINQAQEKSLSSVPATQINYFNNHKGSKKVFLVGPNGEEYDVPESEVDEILQQHKELRRG